MLSTPSHSSKKTEDPAETEPRFDRSYRLWSRFRCLAGAGSWLRFARRRELLPGVTLPARPALLVLATVLLVGLCAILALCGNRQHADSRGFDLPNDISSSNFNSTSAQTPASSPAPAPRVELDKSRPDPDEISHLPPAPEIRVQAVPAPAPVAEAPAPLGLVESVPILPVASLEPAIPQRLRYLHQGDSPMMRTWKRLGLQAVLAALLTATPNLAAGTEGELTDSQRLVEIQKQLNEVKTTLQTIKEKVEDAGKAHGQISDLKRQVAQLQEEVENLRKSIAGQTRISGYSPSDTRTATGTGVVELVNTYPMEMSIVVNGRSYRVAPGTKVMSDPIPAGTFTYEVLGVTERRSRTIAANKTYPIWVHPQP